MTTQRLIELWGTPQGYRLASVVATTYELQADFLEEDLLPVALDLCLPPARGREFRLELERALQETEVSVYFHPGRYQPGLRRSPRIDLIPLPEGRFPKLHAKVALLRFVTPAAPNAVNQVVRLVVGSANLTSSGYRSNIEVAVAVDDAPGCSAEAATAVRDAAAWLEKLVGKPTEQVARQLRDLRAVFAGRPAPERRDRLQFVGLPSAGGFPLLAAPGDATKRLTLASPFWPAGDDLSDVASALKRLCGGRFGSVRLIGPADIDEHGRPHPVMPAGLVRALLKSGAEVSVAAADPGHGCAMPEDDDEGEFDGVAKRRRPAADGSRSLHAKVLLAEGAKTTRLAIGSFNLTRRGLGLVSSANAEAGLLWLLPTSQAASIQHVVAFAATWQVVDRSPEEFVVEPGARDGADGGGWPAFLLSLRAKRTELVLEGDADDWPGPVTIRMRDIRSRLVGQERWFDPWVVVPPRSAKGVFSASTTLQASWLEETPSPNGGKWPALPDLEAEVQWEGGTATVPVVFEDKHLFPVVETRAREDEQSLIAWFLGLRLSGEQEEGGFGHSIDPVRDTTDAVNPTSDILSYLVRDFVHALPGIRNRLAEASMTETGLRAALLGHRSPIELAREALRAFKEHQPGKPRKTPVATAFQLAELKYLLQTVLLPELANSVAETLRAEAVTEVASALDDVVAKLPVRERPVVLRAYLGMARGHA
jgi:hypothetical protein